MNHQIENDVHIERSRSEYAQPVNFKKHGPGNKRRRGPDCGVKAFQVSDLADPMQTPGESKQFVGLSQRSGKRLFRQDIDSGIHPARRFQMLHRGYSDRGGLHFAVRGHQLLDRSKPAAAEFPGDSVGPGDVGVHHAHQADGFAPLRQLVIDAGVVASEGTYTDDRDVDKVLGQL